MLQDYSLCKTVCPYVIKGILEQINEFGNHIGNYVKKRYIWNKVSKLMFDTFDYSRVLFVIWKVYAEVYLLYLILNFQFFKYGNSIIVRMKPLFRLFAEKRRICLETSMLNVAFKTWRQMYQLHLKKAANQLKQLT